MNHVQDYVPWGSVFEYSSIGQFESKDTFSPGVHLIPLDNGGNNLELLVGEGEIELGRRVPVFFSGAITWRNGTVGPYFSGKGIAKRLGTSFFAFSDPLLSYDPKLTLGWYTGLPSWNAMGIMERVCRHLAFVTRRRQLYVGGSGGGFAALAMASRIQESAAFVWNPQTDILAYNPIFVRQYLSVVFGGDWVQSEWREQAGDALRDSGLVSDLFHSPSADNFFYIQNHLDWHLKKHCIPFIVARQLKYERDGFFGGSRSQGVQVANFGKGHAPPAKEVLDSLINELLFESSSASSVREVLEARGCLEGVNFDHVFPKI